MRIRYESDACVRKEANSSACAMLTAPLERGESQQFFRGRQGRELENLYRPHREHLGDNRRNCLSL